MKKLFKKLVDFMTGRNLTGFAKSSQSIVSVFNDTINNLNALNNRITMKIVDSNDEAIELQRKASLKLDEVQEMQAICKQNRKVMAKVKDLVC